MNITNTQLFVLNGDGTEEEVKGIKSFEHEEKECFIDVDLATGTDCTVSFTYQLTDKAKRKFNQFYKKYFDPSPKPNIINSKPYYRNGERW